MIYNDFTCTTLALIHRILLIVTTTVLLKAFEESWALEVTKLANIVGQYFKYMAEQKNISKYICPVL